VARISGPEDIARMQVMDKRVPIDSVFEDPGNARKHGERNLETISNSLRSFGQVESLVVQKSTGKVIGGNGRLRVMKELGWDEVDIAEVDIGEAQSVSLGIALNRTAELAEWNDDILGPLLNGLVTDDEALLEAAGFSEDDLAALLGDLEADGDYTYPNLSAIYEIKITCESETHQQEVYEMLKSKNLECKVMVLQ
jgi:ParB-like chromosome segregation protein Spo0J